jgi:hypothetical protein
MSNRDVVSELQQDVRSIADQARGEFGGLKAEHLNWKPATESWSVAQCFDHLITTNAAYFPVMESIVAGKKQTNMAERLPLLPTLWAKLLIKSLDPKTTRKLKAPPRFQPSSSDISGSIIEDFVAQQSQLADSMEASKDLDVDKIVITSPAASFITYSLLDAFRILVVHEQRHFQQAMRVTQNQSFPRNTNLI